MLDIERGPDIDAGGENLVDVLPALRMPAAGDIGVGVFVDEQQTGMARKCSVEVEFLEDLISINDRLARKNFEAFDERFGLAPAVGFDESGNHVAPVGLRGARGREHGVGLAHARGRTEKDFQMTAPLLLGKGKKGVGRGSRLLFYGHAVTLRPKGIQCDIEFQHVNARLPENPQHSPLDVLADKRAQPVFGLVSRLGDPRHLEEGGVRRDVRIETAARRRDDIDRDRSGLILLLQLVDIAFDTIDERLVGRAEV